MKGFLPRDITPSLLHALASMPVVVLTGMRQTGKSTLLKRLEGRRYVTLDDYVQLEAVRSAPETLLADEGPLTLDEIQRAPDLLIAVKREVDRDRRPGRFLLSGSANLALLAGVSESLAGRAVYLTLHPFSRRERTGGTARKPWILRCFEDGRPPRAERDSEPVAWNEVQRGGMPPVCLGQTPDAALWLRSFEQTYLERDIRDLSQVADLPAFRKLLALAAHRSGQVLNQSELARDAGLSAATARRYVGLIEASYALRLLPPHLGNHASRLIKSPKLYLEDSGLACHLCGAESLRGPLFETYVAQNLASIVNCHWPKAGLAYWHIQGRHEVDFIIEDGRETLAIEVKSGTRWAERDLAGLRAYLATAPGCKAAILALNGTETAALGERLWAAPVSSVLS